jgi:prepilin-type N-terminal cleavage/methylation domain-containing protein
MKLLMNKRGFGFTLIELLMAIAVVSILAMMFVGIVNRARDRANQATVASNLRTIVSASLLYANENNGRIALFADPARQTMGTSAVQNAMPRALFSSDSPFGGHPLSRGAFLSDPNVFHNPRMENLNPPTGDQFSTNALDQEMLGFYYYSLPSSTDSTGSEPYRIQGENLTNELVATSWGRTPMYSEVPLLALADEHGMRGDNLHVGHLDGSVSVRSLSEASGQASWADRLYYMASGISMR